MYDLEYDIDFPVERRPLNGNAPPHEAGRPPEERAVRGRYQRLDIYDDSATDQMAHNVHGILETLGEDPAREGLVKTPERVAKAYQFLTHGYRMDPHAILSKALFEEDYSEMILVKDIEVFSLCEHHMLPFFGKAHIAYIPNGKIVGLSKLPRVVDVFARRLQVQERLTMQIRDAIQEVLQPQGVAVVIEATHLCMVMRGVQKQHSSTTTSAMSGTFLSDQATREEFMRLVHTG
jgi:GTP cyclohydrolase I